MAGDHKSMKWIETLSDDSDDDNRLCPDECENGHGESLAQCPGTEELTRSLYDENAPLTERYRSAWHLLGRLCLKHGEAHGLSTLLCLDSLEVGVMCRGIVDLVVTAFEYEGVNVNAGPHDFVVDVGGKEEVRKFADGLDAGGDRFTPRLLALEVVNRSIHDLELNYESKEA